LRYSPPTCDSPAASYTIPSSDENVSYAVNGTPVAPGEHTVSGSTTITITAVAAPGFATVGAKNWRHVYVATAAVCSGGTVPVGGAPTPAAPTPVAAAPAAATVAAAAPAALANTGPGVVAGKATITGVLLALVGIACLYAGRRPSAAGRHSAARL
jgi:hypothetical protein